MNLKELKQLIPEIFETVRNDVRKIYGWDCHRAGLSLRLAEMGASEGGFIGGMHFYPSTDIIMNTSPLKKILEDKYEKLDDIIWAYTYHILLHEYVHSLGVTNERKCKTITLNISEETFKDKGHPALLMAQNGIGSIIPYLKIIHVPANWRPGGIANEYVKDFDRESQSYFS